MRSVVVAIDGLDHPDEAVGAWGPANDGDTAGVGFAGWQWGVASGPGTDCCGSTGVTGQRTGYPAVHFSLLSPRVACGSIECRVMFGNRQA